MNIPKLASKLELVINNGPGEIEDEDDDDDFGDKFTLFDSEEDALDIFDDEDGKDGE